MRQTLRNCRLCTGFAGAALILLLGACGGGGGGSSSGSTTQTGPRPPTASFTATPSDGLAPLQVSFNAAGSSDPDGTISSYQWDFGDDTQATGGPTVSHTYEDTGRFTVTLTVTDDDGQSDSATRTVQVRGATVSGVIRVAAGSGVDSDVNDEFTTPAANNSFGAAQPVSNPLRLGGFVNVAGSGAEDGNFTTSGDPEDYYFVQLEGGERIVLSIGDPSADLDLELFDDASPPNLVDASVSPNPEDDVTEDFTEDVTAPQEPGGYFVRVLAISGASNYILSISSDSQPTFLRRRAKRLTDPFVPGELLMSAGAREPVHRYRIERARGGRHHHVVRADRAASAMDLRLSQVQAAPGSTMSPTLEARYRTLIAARDANRDAQVAAAEVNVLRQPLAVPNDDFYDLQWHYPAIELEQAWDLTTGAEPGNPDVVVAVVDTGVLLDHPDLQNQFLRDGNGQVVGFDFIQDAARANDGDGLDPNPDDPGDDGRGPGSGSFHGTHVAGTVAADSDNGIGVAGVSWEARLMPLRALGIDGGTTFDVMQAVRYAAGLSNTSGTTPPRRADIINLSLGSDFYSETEQATLNEVRAAGVFVVASAGNGASDVPSYPAAYDGVLSVAASTINDTQAPYSNFGATIDLAAPGGLSPMSTTSTADGVVSTRGEQTRRWTSSSALRFLQGTSMAAPHVSGVIALMKALYPGLRPGEFDRDAGIRRSDR
ncbi:MAG: S8 family serine peptidase [Gammaproteobacteria bacterium]|nr:S8 family serine peptidase [Gammaproteobacteria bacterium]